MFNIDFVRENPDEVKEGIGKKGADVGLVDKLLHLDEVWRSKRQELDELKSQQNELSKKFAGERTEELIGEAGRIKEKIRSVSKEEAEAKEKRSEILTKIPNVPSSDAPLGKDESDNRVLRSVGKKPSFDFKPLDYLSISEKLGIIDVKQAAKVSGSRFGYLLREAALLEFALVKLAFDVLVDGGFIPIIPPAMVRPEVFAGMGRLAPGDEHERYYIPEDNLYLIGSSEHTIGPFHMNEVIPEKDLPMRYVGFSTCFRREAGSYGKDTRGILRVHQFDKVEMFSFVHPDKSEEEHQLLLSFQEKLMKKLKLHYRVVDICTGDMGWTDARQYDIETWIPSEDTYRETHSCSNTTDFQARGVNVRYKPGDGEKPEPLHMLNATALAIGRMVIAIIENYQTKWGTVRIPKALQSLVGKKKIS